MAIAPGSRLGPYEILSALGSGGMGEVWKARDTRLNRLVAIKTSLGPFSDRFAREARAIAAVNHPRVCSLYDVGPDYLVMEYVEGDWLHGPVPLAQALSLAEQILDALDAAHARGIVHRDLKPGNILLTKSGVKVLDFGLAKISEAGGDDPSLAETETLELTAKGSLLGTLPYMSPEQVQGFDADARSDIFSFGVVFYELLAGTRPFTGNTQADLVASILKEDPRPIIEIDPRTPRGVAEVLRTCLEKDPDKRWQSVRDVRHALKLVAAEPPPSAPARSNRVWPAVAAAAVVVVAAAVGFWAFRPAAAPEPVAQLDIPWPDVRSAGHAAISPDGRRVVINSGGLWLRDIDSVEWRRLAGTEGAYRPFWSPDGRYVGFIANKTLKRVDINGGPAETVASINNPMPGTGTWNRRGDILIGSWSGGSGGPLWRVSPGMSQATPLTEVDVSKGEFVHTFPTFLPDGNHFLYFRSGPSDVGGMYVGALDVDAGKQSRDRVLATNVPALFANGHMFFVRAGTLMAQPFDVRSYKLHGEAVPVAQDVHVEWDSTAVFSVSDKVLVYEPAEKPGTFQLEWVDRQGKSLGKVGQPGIGRQFALSPDGTRAVLKDAPYGNPGDLWLMDLASAQLTRFTFTRDVYSGGVWSQDGTRIAYSAGFAGDTIFEKAASGASDPQVLLQERGLQHFPTSWSKDGRFLLYHVENAVNTGYDMWALSVPDRRPHLLLGEAYNEWAAVFSPDMRWVAYVSMELGGGRIFVRPFQASGADGSPSMGAGKWEVSPGGNWPQWRVSSEILLNRQPHTTELYARPVNATGNALELRGALQLLPFPPNRGVNTTPQSHPDGKRYLVEVPVTQHPPRHSVSILLNWPALMKTKKN